MTTVTPTPVTAGAPPRPPALRASVTRRTSHAWWAPYFFFAPFFIIFAAFVIYPLFQSLFLSTQITIGPGRSRFIGAQNFRLLGQDDLFWKSLGNTAFFAAELQGSETPVNPDVPPGFLLNEIASATARDTMIPPRGASPSRRTATFTPSP